LVIPDHRGYRQLNSVPETGANNMAVSKVNNGTNRRNVPQERSDEVLERWSFGVICFNGFIEYN